MYNRTIFVRVFGKISQINYTVLTFGNLMEYADISMFQTEQMTIYKIDKKKRKNQML